MIFLIFYDLKTFLRTFIPVSRISDNEDDIFIFSRNVQKSNSSEILFFFKSKIYECVEK